MKKRDPYNIRRLVRPSYMGPLDRMLIAQKWSARTVDAEIHAMIGGDSDKMVNSAGRHLFVVLGAWTAEGGDRDIIEVREVIDAVNAVHDQAGERVIPDDRRARIVRGLQAANVLRAAIPQPAIVRAATELERRLNAGSVRLSDFEEISQPPKE